MKSFKTLKALIQFVKNGRITLKLIFIFFCRSVFIVIVIFFFCGLVYRLLPDNPAITEIVFQAKTHPNKTSKFDSEFGTKNELDGCYHVYLDVGSNVGIQVRKLFEPDLYKGAAILGVFDSYFGPRNPTQTETVCAVGFEPNPKHSASLKAIEAAHKACGWRSAFYTEVAASHDYGSVTFMSDNDFGHKEWGGNIITDQRSSQV